MWRGTYIAWIPMTERGRIHNVITERDCKIAGFLSVCRKSIFTAKTDKSIFRIAFSCGRRGTAIAVDEEKNWNIEAKLS